MEFYIRPPNFVSFIIFERGSVTPHGSARSSLRRNITITQRSCGEVLSRGMRECREANRNGTMWVITSGIQLVRERAFVENAVTRDVTECKWIPIRTSPCAGPGCVLCHSDLCEKNTDTTIFDSLCSIRCLPIRFELLFHLLSQDFKHWNTYFGVYKRERKWILT